MKRLLVMILAAALLLTACGKKKQTEPPPGETVLVPAPVETISETGDYAVVCEWEEYDAGVERITFFVENHGKEPVETDVDFRLERLEENGGWSEVPMVENAGWMAMAVHISAGGSAPMECYFSAYDYDFSGGGTFRIVKEVNGQTAAGVFRLAEGSAISAEQPYGFPPLEELPERFGAADAVGAEVVFTGEETRNLKAVEEFLEKSGSGVDCQLRTVQDYGEGAPMVIDVIFENGHFLWRMWNQGSVTEQRFSYIVTDGWDLFLSNGVDWTNTERFKSDTAFLIPGGVSAAMVAEAERQGADRLAANVTRYKVWSEDGTFSAALTEAPAEFAVNWQKRGEGSRGELVALPENSGDTQILALKWLGHDLILTCEGAGGRSRVTFRGDTWTLGENS